MCSIPYLWVMLSSQPLLWRVIRVRRHVPSSSALLGRYVGFRVRRSVWRSHLLESFFPFVPSMHLWLQLILFKSFCMSVYDVALWKYFSVTVFNKFRSCYNKYIKKLFGFQRLDSMSGILIDLCLPTADTIVHNARFCLISCVWCLVITL